MTKLILIRHCESEINVNGMIAGHTNTDAQLTKLGREQAEKLAARVQTEYPEIEHIYCSTATRARQTAGYIVNKMNKPISYCEGLLERNYGKFDSLTKKEAEENFPEDWAEWIKTHNIEGGETVQEVADRVGAVVENAFTNDGHNTIAIVTHLGVLRAFMGRDSNGNIRNWPVRVYPLGGICTIKTYDSDKIH